MNISFSRINCFALTLILNATATAAAATEAPPPVRIEAGHSAMWYDPARSGEGWMLEILPDDAAVLYWFTFDDAGQPRWLSGNGQILRHDAGDEIRFAELVAVHGPRFGAYDPAAAVREVKGAASLRFFDCNRGQITFDAYGQQKQFALTRLTRAMGAQGCRPLHGTPGEPVAAYAGQSGSWYDPTQSGQGFSLEWMANGDAALVWFTFDPQGRPYWMTAVGQMQEGRIVFPQVTSVSGGRFAQPFDPEAVIRSPWGSLELSLDCDQGQAHYTPAGNSAFPAGQLHVQRLTRLASPACPWVKPALTDLYTLEWNELPLPEGLQAITPRAVGDDGTVLAHARWNDWQGVVRLPAGQETWERLLENAYPAHLSPDGKTLYAEQGDAGTSQVLRWREAKGWQPLPGLSGSDNKLSAISPDGHWLAGSNPQSHWIWSEADGQVPLPGLGPEDNDHAVRISALSNDGTRLIGGWEFAPRQITPVHWFDSVLQYFFAPGSGGLPLKGWAAHCNADCSIVSGGLDRSPYNSPPEFPSQEKPWFWKDKTVTAIALPESAAGGRIASLSSDGSLMAGFSWNAPSHESSPWLWSQDTGLALLQETLQAAGAPTSMFVVDASSDGRLVLLQSQSGAPGRIGLLRLQPKAAALPQ